MYYDNDTNETLNFKEFFNKFENNIQFIFVSKQIDGLSIYNIVCTTAGLNMDANYEIFNDVTKEEFESVVYSDNTAFDSIHYMN